MSGGITGHLQVEVTHVHLGHLGHLAPDFKYLKIKHIKLPQTLPIPLSSQLSLAKVINEMKERKM